MGFRIFEPHSYKTIINETTTNNIVDQLLQELTMLRFINPRSLKKVSPWVDQGNIYFGDATKVNWRTAGLLYYYSFLNISKALLVVKNKFNYRLLDTSKFHHGLTSSTQDISFLPDYQICVHPLTNTTVNIFPKLYQAITGDIWPFQTKITISLSEILGYCNDIYVELESLFKIKRKIIYTQSLIREQGNDIWFEMAIPKSQLELIEPLVKTWPLEVVNFEQLSPNDRVDWIISYHKLSGDLYNYYVLRTKNRSFTEETKEYEYKILIGEVRKKMKPNYCPSPIENEHYPVWFIVAKNNLNNHELKWHPLLSNYLFSFALSQILRYQPQLLKSDTPNYHLAGAWCSQSALSTLKFLLMNLSNPPIRVRESN